METRSNLEPRARRAVSTYVEVMVLMALVLGTSALVYLAATNISASGTGGASVSISLAAIRQGADAAVEKVTVANTGTVTITSFTMTTVGVTSSAACYTSSSIRHSGRRHRRHAPSPAQYRQEPSASPQGSPSSRQ